MERAYFSVEVQRDGTTLSLKLAGELDWAVTGHVEGALEKARSQAVEHIVFDLGELDFLDLAGLKTILKTSERGARERFNVTVVRPRGPASAIFALTGAEEKLAMVDHL